MKKKKKRADGRYLAQILIGYNPNGKPKYKNIYAYSIAELTKKELEARELIQKGVFLADKSTTFGQYAQKWLDTIKLQLSANSIKMYEAAVNAHLKKMGFFNARLLDIRGITVRNALTVLADRRRTYQIVTMTAKRILRQAFIDGYTLTDISAQIDNVPYKAQEKRSLMEYEREALEKAELNDQDLFFLRLMLNCGLRKGEALAVFPADIDLKSRRLHISKTVIFLSNSRGEIKHSPKTDAGNRQIPIPAKLLPFFKKMKDGGKEPFQPIIQNPRTGGVVNYRNASNMWKRILEAASKKSEINISLTMHLLRHTYATDLYNAGVPIKTAQYWMGHSNLQVLLGVYTHPDGQGQDEAATAYEKRVGLGNEASEN